MNENEGESEREKQSIIRENESLARIINDYEQNKCGILSSYIGNPRYEVK